MDNENIINKKFQKEIASGISSLVLLKLVERKGEPMYGYQVAKLLESVSGDKTQLVKQGAIYPVLRSLEKSELLSSEVEPSVSGPPRRYYTITKEGKQSLKDWINIWNQTSGIVEKVLKGENND
jgi:PadR family transcriptional regulator PadR